MSKTLNMITKAKRLEMIPLHSGVFDQKDSKLVTVKLVEEK